MSRPKKPVEPKPVKTALERSIESRQRGIDRMEANKVRIMEMARKQCAAIDKSLAEKRVLLDAMKRGSLKA